MRHSFDLEIFLPRLSHIYSANSFSAASISLNDIAITGLSLNGRVRAYMYSMLSPAEEAFSNMESSAPGLSSTSTARTSTILAKYPAAFRTLAAFSGSSTTALTMPYSFVSAMVMVWRLTRASAMALQTPSRCPGVFSRNTDICLSLMACGLLKFGRPQMLRLSTTRLALPSERGILFGCTILTSTRIPTMFTTDD